MKNDEESITDYAQPVHVSLMTKRQFFGVGEKAFYAIVLFTLIMCCMVSVYCIGIGIIALLICKRLCRDEPLFLDFIFENLNEQDKYEV